MSKITLADARKSFEDFIGEARLSARDGRGFAAMCTIFPVVLTAAEADLGKPKGTKALPKNYFSVCRADLRGEIV